MKTLEFNDEKYTVILPENGERFRALRYGEEWRDLTGDNLVYWITAEYQQLEAERDALKAENERLQDKRPIYNDLVNAFIHHQYRLENPMPSTSETEQTRIVKYQSDPIFHAKVDSLAAGVMQIIDKHR